MTTRMAVSVALMLSFFCVTTVALSQDTVPGWGVVVNRTSDAVVIKLKASSGTRSTSRLQPDEALQLRRDTNYTAYLNGQPRQSVSLDVVPQYVEIDGNGSLSRVERTAVESPEYYSRSAWSLRCFRVEDTEQGQRITPGFGQRDVGQVLHTYRSRMRDLGFDPEMKLAYQPYQPSSRFDDLTNSDDPPTTEKIRRNVGNAARQMQHCVLKDAILDWVAADAQDIDPMSVLPGTEEFSLYVGREELEQIFSEEMYGPEEIARLNDELRSFEAAVVLLPREISAEVDSFARLVVADLLHVDPSKIAIVFGTSPHGAASGWWPIKEEIVNTGTPVSAQLISAAYAEINAEPFLRTLSFGRFVNEVVSHDVYGETRQAKQMRSRSRWRYHRLSDEVLVMDEIPSMRGMDLRWRLIVECDLADLGDNELHLQTIVGTEVQTKRRLQSARKYTPWTIDFSTFWIRPIQGDFDSVDLKFAANKLQDQIMERCADFD